MKIAIQLYGHLRTFEKCAPALQEHVLDHYDCDVFMHTWNQTEHSTRSWYNNSVRSVVKTVDESVMAVIEELYAPKAIKVEAQNMFEEKGYFGTHDQIQISLQGMKYMTFSQYQVNKLREEYAKKYDIDYDYVLVIRPDIMPFVEVDFSRYQNEFKFFDNISIHFVHNSEMKILSSKVVNNVLAADCFYFSRPDVVSRITSLFESFDFYYKDINRILPPQLECPEIAFFESIRQKGIIPRQYLNYFAIKRHHPHDDIKLMPPVKGGESNCVKIAKYILRFIAIFSPRIITRQMIRFFDLIGRCGQYIQKSAHIK